MNIFKKLNSLCKIYLYCTETNKFTKKSAKILGECYIYYDKDYYNNKMPISILKEYTSKNRKEALMKSINNFNRKIENVKKCKDSIKQSLELKLKIIMGEAVEIGGWVIDKDKPIEKPNLAKIIDYYLPTLYKLDREELAYNQQIDSLKKLK